MKAIITVMSMVKDWDSYEVEKESDCRDEVDLSAYKSAMKHYDVIQMGCVLVEPVSQSV